jgi:hypothetical protein
MAISAGKIGYEIHRSRILTRNFYSALRIVDFGSPPNAWRRLEDGGIEHGSQYLDQERRREPISYYSGSSGVALAFARQRQVSRPGHLAVGIVGLGAGALAAYGEAGDRFRFYEINPQVLTLARTEFTYLSDSQANVSVALGDARLVLEREPPQGYDALIIDAFSGDAIPIHLLTREAVQVYRKHLNAFVPVLARVQPGFALRLNHDEVDDAFEVPLAFLMTPQSYKRESRDWNGLTVRRPKNLGRDRVYTSKLVRAGISSMTRRRAETISAFGL